MSFIDSLERKFGKYIPSNITNILIFGQVIGFMVFFLQPKLSNLFLLKGDLILSGEWWRIILFLFSPLSHDIIFIAFVLYIYYLYGTVLEERWGSFRYFLYLLIAYIGTIIVSFLYPHESLSNGYFYLSLFLAFAHLYPDFMLYIFFIIPVKVKWLAIISWIFIAITLIFGSFSIRIFMSVSLINFLLFFWRDIIYSSKQKITAVSNNSPAHLPNKKAIHICFACALNEIKDPKMEIIYCQQCKPVTCYCGRHYPGHKHRKE